MTLQEFEGWWSDASAESLEAVIRAGCRAMDAWEHNAWSAIELADLQPWRRWAVCTCPDCLVRAAETAALATAEIEVIRSIWPAPLDRPLGQGIARRGTR